MIIHDDSWLFMIVYMFSSWPLMIIHDYLRLLMITGEYSIPMIILFLIVYIMIYWHYTYIYTLYVIYWYMYCDACLGWPQTLKRLLAPSSHPAIIYLQQHLRQLCIYNCPLMTILQYFFCMHCQQHDRFSNRSQPTNDLHSAWPFGMVASARNGRLLSYLSSPLQHMMGAIPIG